MYLWDFSYRIILHLQHVDTITVAVMSAVCLHRMCFQLCYMKAVVFHANPNLNNIIPSRQFKIFTWMLGYINTIFIISIVLCIISDMNWGNIYFYQNFNSIRILLALWTTDGSWVESYCVRSIHIMLDKYIEMQVHKQLSFQVCVSLYKKQPENGIKKITTMMYNTGMSTLRLSIFCIWKSSNFMFHS